MEVGVASLGGKGISRIWEPAGGHRTGGGHDRTKAWRALTCDGISKGHVVGRISRGGESWMSPWQMGFRGKLNPDRGGELRSLPGRVEFREGTPRWTNS